MRERTFENFLRKFWQTSSPLSFCFIIFVVSRVLFWQQAVWLNSIFRLHAPPVMWFFHFDSNWYHDIVEHGYNQVVQACGRVNYVFFPLLPLVVRGLAQVTHISSMWVGQIFCQGCFLVSLWLFYRVVTLRVSEAAARFGVLILAFSPFNIYFSSFYTESLFLVLSLGIWLAALHRQWLIAGVLAALLSATRPNGVMIVVPLIYFAFIAFKEHKLKLNVAFVLLAPLGLLAFMLFLAHHFGDALAFVHNQAMWGRTGWHVHGFFHELGHNLSNHYNTYVFLLSVFLIVCLVRADFMPEALYFVAILLPSFTSGTFDSLARYSATLFSFYFAFAVITQNKHYLKLFVFALCLVYSGVYMSGWINDAGMFI